MRNPLLQTPAMLTPRNSLNGPLGSEVQLVPFLQNSWALSYNTVFKVAKTLQKVHEGSYKERFLKAREKMNSRRIKPLWIAADIYILLCIK